MNEHAHKVSIMTDEQAEILRLRARVAELETAMPVTTTLTDGRVVTAPWTKLNEYQERRVAELEAEVARLKHDHAQAEAQWECDWYDAGDYHLIESYLNGEPVTTEFGGKLCKRVMDRIADLEQLVSMLKRDAADGDDHQHFMDGAEAALEWAAEEMLRRDTEIRSFIQRGLDAVGGK